MVSAQRKMGNGHRTSFDSRGAPSVPGTGLRPHWAPQALALCAGQSPNLRIFSISFKEIVSKPFRSLMTDSQSLSKSLFKSLLKAILRLFSMPSKNILKARSTSLLKAFLKSLHIIMPHIRRLGRWRRAFCRCRPTPESA